MPNAGRLVAGRTWRCSGNRRGLWSTDGQVVYLPPGCELDSAVAAEPGADRVRDLVAVAVAREYDNTGSDRSRDRLHARRFEAACSLLSVGLSAHPHRRRARSGIDLEVVLLEGGGVHRQL